MAHRSQSSSVGDNPLDPNYLPPHYREEYRLAIDALVEEDLQGYYEFLQSADVVDFLAQPEIEHIKSTIQAPYQVSNAPELTYHERAMEEDGSSDTYWPVHSDLAAPGLDLGWPMQQHSFIGPTEVTTLVNPSDPDMPSIKEQARRLIKNAHKVIAVVMDMFTDVDIFSDLLDAAARHVPVYILLDEHNAHHFVAMVTNCRVNLDLVHTMRVRTVSGITYFCRTGKSFKGQVKDRFLLADCRAVLSGSYSFMWSFEKIHRCIAHLFLGELVTTFDEEFRILFAQSQPLIIDQSVVPLARSDTSSTSSYLSSQFGLKRTQSLLNPRSFLRQPELPSALSYGDSDRNAALPFRRNDLFRHSMEPGAGITIGKYSQQQFRLQQSYLEQGRSIVSRQMEMSSSAFKRHSYAEGTQESYSSSRQYMKQRVMNNLDEMDYHREQSQEGHYFHEGSRPGSGHGHYDRHRGRVKHLAIDQYSDSSFPSEPEPLPPGHYGQDYLSSDDLRGTEGCQGPPIAGRYGGGSSHKRPSIGQAYVCQSSPTQPHPPEKHAFPKQSDQDRDQDSSVKQGLRSWRINSYLSTYEDGGEEGLPQPMGPDAFEDQPSFQQPNAAETSAPRFGKIEQPNVLSKPDILRPRYGKPIIPENKHSAHTKATRDPISSGTDFKPSILDKEREREAEREREREWERGGTREVGVDVEAKETPEITLSKHESFRTRINPLLQRSSRLRSSLIFSSSKVETHSGGLGLRPAAEEDEQSDPVRTSSIVAQILEKRRSMSREPFEWRKKAEEKREKEKETDKGKEETQLKNDSQSKEEPQKISQEVKTPIDEETLSVTKEPLKTQETSSLNMNDPASRLQYFKDLAAKRKLSKVGTESSLKGAEPAEKKPGFSEKSPANTSTMTPNVPPVSTCPPAPEPKKSSISSKLGELTQRSSFSANKPSITADKPSVTVKPSAHALTQKEENVTEVSKKDPFKSLKPFPSPKLFKRDPLKLKGLNPRRISCGEEIVTTDATDAEKSELKKTRPHSSSTMTSAESKEMLHKLMGSSTSINMLGGEGKSEGKPLDFLKKQTQRLKGFLGPKDKEKKSATETDDKNLSTVMGGKQTSSSKDTGSINTDQSSANHKTSGTATMGSSRYQTSSSSVLFSSNLRDDTKVILEQISANNQKTRLEREETAGDKESDGREKGLDKQNSLQGNRFPRPQANPLEREGLLKRIESMRKEKKVYSRFEVLNRCQDE